MSVPVFFDKTFDVTSATAAITTDWVKLNLYGQLPITVAADVNTTDVTYTAQVRFNRDGTDVYAALSNLTAKNAGASDMGVGPCTGVRFTATSGVTTGTLRVIVIQNGHS